MSNKNNRQAPKPQLPEVLAECEMRFLMNLPEEELNNAVRVFMQIEQAHWFYEDFFVDNHKHLKSMKMKAFSQALFEQSAVLSPISDKCEQMFTQFKNYRHQIPVCGAIMLNEKCDRMLLVRSWQGKSWTFPRGKINEGEEEAPCAAREVYEETGYLPAIDPEQHARLEAMDHGKKVILFVVPGVVENQDFAPKARKEVSKVDWFPLNAVPKGHYNVAPFMGRLKKIAASLRKQAKQGKHGKNSHTLKVPQSASKKQCNNLSPNSRTMRESADNQPKELLLNPSSTSAKVNGRKGRKQQKHSHARGAFGTEDTYDFDNHNQDTFENNALGGGMKKGSSKKGWGIEDMFAANEKITGLQYTYDGNPHTFGEQSEKAVRVGQDTQRSSNWRAEGNEHVTATSNAPAPTYQNTARPSRPVTRSQQKSNKNSGARSGTTGLTPSVAALFASAVPVHPRAALAPAVNYPAPPTLNPSVAALFASATAQEETVSPTTATVVAVPTLNPSVAALFAFAANAPPAPPQPAPAANAAPMPQSCAAAVSASGCGWKGGLLMPMSSQ